MTRMIRTFQFHKGTIKTSRALGPGGKFYKFQFHKGTIKTTEPDTGGNGGTDFNSIKVRLKLPSR